VLRVLIETADPALAISDFSRYAAAGLDVALCAGPDGRTDGCPLVNGHHCELVDAADVVLSGLGDGDVLRALAAAHGHAPVVVGLTPTSTVPEGCIDMPVPCSVEGQIRILRAAAVEGRGAAAHLGQPLPSS
jgi:hypothetical protein